MLPHLHVTHPVKAGPDFALYVSPETMGFQAMRAILLAMDRVDAKRSPAASCGSVVNVVEVDHGKLKRLIRPVRGFKTLKTAYATINGFEVMRASRKGQAGMFNLTRDVRGEARIVERAFGIGQSALTEMVALLAQTVEAKAG